MNPIISVKERTPARLNTSTRNGFCYYFLKLIICLGLLLAITQAQAQIVPNTAPGGGTNPPHQPGDVSGPTPILQGDWTTSTYTVLAGMYATSYAWSIIPTTAGTISGTSTTGTLHWNAAFSGTVTVYCTGLNGYGSASAVPLTVTVTPAQIPLVAGTISPASQSVNVNTSVTLTGTAATGGNNSYTYQWQSSPFSGGTFVNITGATGQNYTTTAITVNTYFQRLDYSNGQTLPTNTAAVLINSCLPLGTNPQGSMNYVISSTLKIPGITSVTDAQIAGMGVCQANQTIQYIDGIGRPIQTIQVKASPTGRDIVQPIAYDQYDREINKYLPYSAVANTNGSYQSSAITDQASFYNTPGGSTWNAPSVMPIPVSGTTTPSYAQTVYEPSPLNRVLEQGAPGAAWQPVSGSSAGHTIKMVYTANNATAFTSDTANGKQVRMFVTTINSDNSRTLSVKGYYAPNTLDVTISKDENWKSGRGGTTETYKDVLGHTILKRVYNYSGGVLQQLSTFYVYDDLDNLAFVLTPGSLADNGLPAQATLDTWCYQYRYDTRNRLIQKSIPGKGWNYIIYNALDQVIATQDAVQRGQSSQQWTFTKYDAQGRVILSGIALYGVTAGVNNQAALQMAVNTYTSYWETPTTATGNGYTATAWPTGWSTNLIANYYDDYSFTTGRPAAFNAPSGSSTMTKGLLTATKAYVLGTSDPLWTVNYYDDLGRVIQTDKQHYLGGVLSQYNYDIITNGYDFANELLSTTRLHYVKNSGGTAAVQGATVAIGYAYDNTGRKTQTTEAIALGSNALTAPILLSQESYNEIGQLMTKKLHSSDGGLTFLQNTAYLYNERGWLSQINDPSIASSPTKLFSEKLNYNNPAYGASAQYNGNIAETDYNASVSGRQHVVYGYDPLNRLLAGTSSAGFSETGITYDNMGNIITLKRGANPSTTYGYTGNQLMTLTGSINGANIYDVNGNLYTDGTRGNAAIRYNMLNLPQTVSGTGVSITYTYAADGTKLRKVSSAGTTDYIGGIQYKSNSTAIDFIQTEEGRAINSGGSWNYEYTLTDHLGNNRVTFDIVTGKVGEDDYYPFGLNTKRQVNSTNNYLYNKKELQSELNEYDYGARFYDPVIARWTTVDPLAEQDRRLSPYMYGFDDPMRFTDPDGMWPDWGELVKGTITTVGGVLGVATGVVGGTASSVTVVGAAGGAALAAVSAGAVVLGGSQIADSFRSKGKAMDIPSSVVVATAKAVSKKMGDKTGKTGEKVGEVVDLVSGGAPKSLLEKGVTVVNGVSTAGDLMGDHSSNVKKSGMQRDHTATSTTAQKPVVKQKTNQNSKPQTTIQAAN